MKRTLSAALLCVALSACAVEAKTALVVTGILGEFLMEDIKAALRKSGYKLIVAPWYFVPNVKVDVAIGHSAGADAVLRTSARRIETIDPTFVNQGCPTRAKCVNRYAPLDAFPLIICCGGYQVRGARNIQVAPNHLTMPARVAKAIVAEVNGA